MKTTSRARKPQESKQCGQCGDSFERPRAYSHAQWTARKFCGRECQGVAHRGTRRFTHEYEVRDCGFDSPCWVSTYAPNGNGYSQMFAPSGERGIGHRIMFERHRGPIPEGLELDHLCRNRRCVNPDHLEPVTPAENSRRGANTKLTLEQVREIRVANGSTPEIGRRFGISQAHAWRIRAGEAWQEAA